MGDDGWESVPIKRRDRRTRDTADEHIPPFLQRALDQGRIPKVTSTPHPSSQRKVILLMGLPGSGKSLFSKLLEQYAPNHYIRINQDELQSRQVCLDQVRAVLRQQGSSKSVVVDRCHVSREQRKYFVDVAKEMHRPVHLLWFSTGADVCLQRCLGRRKHPTLSRADAPEVMARMASELQIPQSQPEHLTELHVIDSDATFLHVILHYLTL
jgi:predicted kinase